jgi:hypothetical protein
MIDVISMTFVSVYLYRQVMASIKETSGASIVKPMSWLEFLSDNDRPLHDIWQWTLNAREIRQRFDTPVEDDEHWDKTWLMNAIAWANPDYATVQVMWAAISRRFAKVHAEGISDLRVVPTTMKAMLHAAQARRNIAPGAFAVTPEETEWQRERIVVCNHVIVCLNHMKATAIAEDENPAPDVQIGRPHRAFGVLKPYFDDEKRRRWMKTSDDGCWENDLGEKWDEDDHNGMRPYDECGDTESEEDEEMADCDGAGEVPDKQRVLAMCAPAPGSQP